MPELVLGLGLDKVQLQSLLKNKALKILGMFLAVPLLMLLKLYFQSFIMWVML